MTRRADTASDTAVAERPSVAEGSTASPHDLDRFELPPARMLRSGGRYEVEDPRGIPSLPELLAGLADTGADLRDPAIAGVVPAADVVRYGVQHDVELDEVLRLLRRDDSYESLIEKGLLQNMYLNFVGYEQGDPVLRRVGVPLPVAELHAAPLEGCTSTYMVAAEAKHSAGLKLEVRGVGAGAGVSAKLRFEDQLWTEAACGQVSIRGDLEIVPWTNADSGKTIYLVSVRNISAGEWSLTAIPTGRTHLCSPRFEHLLATFTERERRGWLRSGSDFFRHEVSVPGGLTRKRTVEQGRKFSLDLGGVIELKSQFTAEYSYSYQIVARADYVGFYENEESEVFFWTWRT